MVEHFVARALVFVDVVDVLVDGVVGALSQEATSKLKPFVAARRVGWRSAVATQQCQCSSC